MKKKKKINKNKNYKAKKYILSSIIVCLLLIVAITYGFEKKFQINEAKKYTSNETMFFNIGDQINLNDYVENLNEANAVYFSNNNIFLIDEKYNMVAIQEGDTELHVAFNDGTQKTIELSCKVITSNAATTSTKEAAYSDKINGNRCYVDGNNKIVYYITTCQPASGTAAKCKYTKANGTASSGIVQRNKLKGSTSNCNSLTISLNNQAATNAGTREVYLKYNTGIFLNLDFTKQMSTSNNKITIPSKTGYEFKGYYTKANGGGTKLISENGSITSSFSKTYFISPATIYAYWIGKYSDTINGYRCMKSTDKGETLYYITTCQPTTVANAKCNYNKVDGVTKSGTVVRNKLSAASNCTQRLSEYSDKINGNRCYVNGTTKITYYITECQPSASTNAKCKYTKANDVSQTGTVLRNKLIGNTNNCNSLTYTLNNQNANNAGTTAVYLKYNNGVYIDTGLTKKMTETNNKITIPIKAGYTFKGYYTKTNGQGTKLINENGFITSSFTPKYSLNQMTLYAYWYAGFNDQINGDRCNIDSAGKRNIYYITTCQSPSVENAKCKYTKVNGVNSTGTIVRNTLSAANICTDGNIIGATGFTAVNNRKSLKKEANNNSQSIATLKTGEPFRILESVNNDTWWKVNYNGQVGYVENAYCMINLPDYIPSIVYYMYHTEPNKYTASGIKLSVYGKVYYTTGKVYNERLGRNEYIVPVVYSFAKKILIAERNAEKEGYNLKIYDAYRPKSVADDTNESLKKLYNSNQTVRNGIDYSYEANGKKVTWGTGWFLAQNLSAHSVGAAIDVVLVYKDSKKELEFQSQIQDLSTASVKYSSPVSGQTTVRNDLYSIHANQHTKTLDRIMLSSGMTNLASEWWHFQDNETYQRIKGIESNGLNFQPSKIVSSK